MFNFKRYYFYISDFIFAIVTFIAIFKLRYSSVFFPSIGSRELTKINLLMFCGYACTILIFNTAMKLYELNNLSQAKESIVNAYLSVIACAFTWTFIFYISKYDFARFVFFSSLMLVPIIQIISHKIIFKIMVHQNLQTKIYYLGSEKNWNLTNELLNKYNNILPSKMIKINSVKEININPKKENHLIVIDPCTAQKKEELALIYEYELNGYKLCNAAALFEYIDQSLPSELIYENEMELFSSYRIQTSYNRILKRIGDIFISLFLLIILSPLILLTMLLIKLTSKGPIFYHQKRIGLYNKEFVMHKFRTMKTDAEKGKAMLTVKGDSRITAIGKIIRPIRIDELPQLINILKGEMSFVGPRPERRELMEKITEQHPLFYKRLLVKPGLTGWAQVKFQYANSIEEMNKKLSYDLYYIKSISLLFDLKILLYTIETVIFKRGAL